MNGLKREKTTRHPVSYRCNKCKRVEKRNVLRLWMNSWCEETGKMARLYRISLPNK